MQGGRQQLPAGAHEGRARGNEPVELEVGGEKVGDLVVGVSAFDDVAVGVGLGGAHSGGRSLGESLEGLGPGQLERLAQDTVHGGCTKGGRRDEKQGSMTLETEADTFPIRCGVEF